MSRILNGPTGALGLDAQQADFLAGGEDKYIERLWSKIFKLRIFGDVEGKTNRSLADVAGAVLIVSQFTLYADCRRGNRPSFAQAGAPDAARALYERFVKRARRDVAQVETGEFGANMQVSLENDGPFTIYLDTADWKR